jgi:hypothetical protein
MPLANSAGFSSSVHYGDSSTNLRSLTFNSASFDASPEFLPSRSFAGSGSFPSSANLNFIAISPITKSIAIPNVNSPSFSEKLSCSVAVPMNDSLSEGDSFRSAPSIHSYTSSLLSDNLTSTPQSSSGASISPQTSVTPIPTPSVSDFFPNSSICSSPFRSHDVFIPDARGSGPATVSNLGTVLGVVFGLLALIGVGVATWFFARGHRDEHASEEIPTEYETEVSSVADLIDGSDENLSSDGGLDHFGEFALDNASGALDVFADTFEETLFDSLDNGF